VTKAYCQLIAAAPVDEVEVEVVLEGRCIEYFARHFVDLAHSLQMALPNPQGMEIVFTALVNVLGSETQNVSVPEGSQLLISCGIFALASQHFLIENLSDRNILGVFLAHHQILRVLVPVIVVEHHSPVRNETIDENLLLAL
jgi:hypothetical protein